MTRAELRAALDDLQTFARNAWAARLQGDHAGYQTWGQQVAAKRNEIRAATLDIDSGGALLEFLAEASRTTEGGDETRLTELRLALRGATLR